MPLFDYKAANPELGKQCCSFENLESQGETPLSSCPTCNGAVVRAISCFGITGSHAPKQTSVTDSQSTKKSTTAAERIAKLATTHSCAAGCGCKKG